MHTGTASPSFEEAVHLERVGGELSLTVSHGVFEISRVGCQRAGKLIARRPGKLIR